MSNESYVRNSNNIIGALNKIITEANKIQEWVKRGGRADIDILKAHLLELEDYVKVQDKTARA